MPLLRSAFRFPRALGIVLLVLNGCSEPVCAPPDAGHAFNQSLYVCAVDAGPVTSVAGVVGWINALPHPVDGPHMVASLPRPLSVVGTVGTVSAQPAGGVNDPRVFIMNQGVVIAVVSAGDGSKAIELGEWVSSSRTLKAEILLPVADPLPVEQPVSHIEQDGGGTLCGMCHRSEVANTSVAHGYDSAAYRPLPTDEVKLPALQALHQGCVTSGEVSARCDMFHALFDFGEVTQGVFSKDVEYFFQ